MSTNKYDNQLKRKYRPLYKQLRPIEERIYAIMQDVLTTDRTDNAYYVDIKRKLDVQYSKADKLTSEWSKENLPKQYRWSLREQHAKSKRIKTKTNQAKLSINQLLKTKESRGIQVQLVKSAIADMRRGLTGGREDLNRVLAATRQTNIAESAIDMSLMKSVGEGNIRLSKILSRRGTLANKLRDAQENKRYIRIIDKNKQPRRYRITYYSEMVYRVKWHEAQSEAVKTNNVNWGTDLIRVSSHNTVTEICQEYEGKVMSLTGRNKDFPIADQVPPYHVNCLHYITTTFAESMKVNGTYDDYSKFSKGESNQPPYQQTFIPTRKRNKIVNNTVSETKSSQKYKDSTPKQKRVLIRDNVSEALGDAAHEQVAA